MRDFLFDGARPARIGLAEAIFCQSKTPAQIAGIVETMAARGESLLLTRLDAAQHAALPPPLRGLLAYDPLSRTAVLGEEPAPAGPPEICIAAAGTGDVPVALEAARTLAFHGKASLRLADLGVAGLWRLLERREEIAAFPVIIALAGMEGAFFSVLAGLVPGAVIAVPVSHGYGVAEGGHAALTSALASCAPGVLTVNIDNGYGAACAALRILHARRPG